MKRRALLSALGSAGVSCLAGCSGLLDDELPTGTVRFENRHDLPHVVELAVLGVGTDQAKSPSGVAGEATVPSEQRNLTMTCSLAPNETTTFEQVFTEPVYYGIEFTVDGRTPENANAAQMEFYQLTDSEQYGSVLTVTVTEEGGFDWVIRPTTNLGGVSPATSE